MKPILARALLIATTAFLLFGSAQAERFRMQTFLGENATTTIAFQEMADALREATDGEVDIEVLPGGAVVGVTETLDAIENGLLDGEYTAPSYFAGKDPAFAVLGDTLAAFPTLEERDGWFTDGGGLELARSLYDEYGLHLVGLVYWPVEQIPSTKAVNSIADFQGYKIRSPEGLVGDLLTRAGATIVNLPVSETVNALETGVVDGADIASPSLNVAIGLHNAAKYSIAANHSSAITEVSVSKAKWDALSSEAQAAFEGAVADMSATLAERLQADDAAAVQLAEDDLGVTFIEFGDADKETLRNLVFEIWDDWSQKSPETKAIIDSYRAYLEGLN